jgi:hypothetical protein
MRIRSAPPTPSPEVQRLGCEAHVTDADLL